MQPQLREQVLAAITNSTHTNRLTNLQANVLDEFVGKDFFRVSS